MENETNYKTFVYDMPTKTKSGDKSPVTPQYNDIGSNLINSKEVL